MNLVTQLLDIGIALSGERDRNKLLSKILDAAMTLTGCDGGTLYILKENALYFHIMVTKSQGIYQNEALHPIKMPPVPMERCYVAACCAIDKEQIVIPDVYEESRFNFTGTKRYDQMTGYHSVSMMVVPMKNDYGDVIGVLQLLNALDEEGRPIPFARKMERLVMAIASQAAILLTNINYAAEVTELLNSLVRVLSTAIDARTPYNANHTKNMARYAERFLDYLETNGQILHPDENLRRQFMMSVWLHDIGKLVIPLEVMDKKSRLDGRLLSIIGRLKEARLCTRIAMLEGKISPEEQQIRQKELMEAQNLMLECDKMSFLTDEKLEQISKLSELKYQDEEGIIQQIFTQEDIHCLTIRRGTLTTEERSVMESHVVITERMLNEVAFSDYYKKVPIWAGSHHELLNGQGYPKGLKEEEIPYEVRLLTILDIFDALTAKDRPYKPPLSNEKAFKVLEKMADEGNLDHGILHLFKQSKVWIMTEEETECEKWDE